VRGRDPDLPHMLVRTVEIRGGPIGCEAQLALPCPVIRFPRSTFWAGVMALAEHRGIRLPPGGDRSVPWL